MSIELRIKSKHLALEPAIIRNEERKLQRQIKWLNENGKATEAQTLRYKLDSLISHRREDVANEARATFLARAFIAGKPYASVERNVKNKDLFKQRIFPRIVAMIKKYKSWQITDKDIWEWVLRTA